MLNPCYLFLEFIFLKLLVPQFSDMLLYTGRGASGTSRFRIRGLLPLRGMLVSARRRAGPDRGSGAAPRGSTCRAVHAFSPCYGYCSRCSNSPTCSPSRAS